MAQELEIPPVRIYPMGLHHGIKESVLEFLPPELQDDAKGWLRTPEETAVIFAKVSRAAMGFDEIAKSVDEEGAADFLGKWVVSVEGYGHGSVAEHALVQLSIENVASADGDDITDNRLGAYTEFSARFKGRQSMGYMTPTSVATNPNLAEEWHDAHKIVFEACDELTARGKEWVFTEEAQSIFPQLQRNYYQDEENKDEANFQWRARLGKHAADQFKNMLPGSRLTSIGVSWNGREAESALTKLLSSRTLSDREMGERATIAAKLLAPTLVKYARFNAYRASQEERRNSLLGKYNLYGQMGTQAEDASNPSRIVRAASIEVLELAAFAFESSYTGSYEQLVTKIGNLPQEKIDEMIQAVLVDKIDFEDFQLGTVESDTPGAHDPWPRAFEFTSEVIEMPSMTYGDWRDYKRHRMQTYTAKPLDNQWGYAVPPLAGILDNSADPKFHGSVDLFKYAVEHMGELVDQVRNVNPDDAKYAVTRAHFRPAIAQFSPREAKHLISLRTGNTAHPSVRQLIWKTYDVFSKAHPALAKSIVTTGQREPIAFP